jgi:site-specific DNA recombinase
VIGMTAATLLDNDDVLAGWLSQAGVPRQRGRRAASPVDRLRFAFYGRISTADYQDEVSSRRWQYDSAAGVIAGRGTIIAEYFDIGCSRRLPWTPWPQAAALLAALADPGRGFDAVIVGEYERAFCGRQLHQLLPRFERPGVQLWLPETDGPIRIGDPIHQALIMLLGRQSQRELLRSRFRTTAAMRVQARDQGRHLGGRPPYGYQLVDAGPHPNRAHARWGRRCTAWTRIRTPPNTYSGSSRNASPDTAPPASPAR